MNTLSSSKQSMSTLENVLQFTEGNFRWLHTLTTGKTLVSRYWLTEYYSKDIIGCKREIVELFPTGNDSELAGSKEYNAIDRNDKNRGIFYEPQID